MLALTWWPAGIVALAATAGRNLPQDFPLAIPLLTLDGLAVLTLIVIRRPLHRATRILPGTALRHQ